MKKEYLFIFYLVLIYLNLSDLSAQVKDKNRLESPKSRLKLPEALVNSMDTQIRLSGFKLSIAGDKARLIPHFSAYKALDIKAFTSDEKVYVRPENRTLDAIHKYSLGYGRFNAVNAAFMRWQRLYSIEYTVGAKFQRSDGQYDNSQFKSGEFDGKFSYSRRPRVRVETSAGYTFRDYFLQGSALKEHQRKAGILGLSLKSQFRGTKTTYGSLKIHYNTFKLSNDTLAGAYTNNLQEQTLALSGQTFWNIANLRVSLKASFLNNNFQFGEQTQTDYISALLLKSNYKYNPELSFTFGIHLNNISIENADPETNFMPFGKIIYSRKNRWGFHIAGSREYIYQTYQNVWRKNYFTAELIDRLAQNVQYKIDIGAEFQLKKDCVLKLKWKTRQIKNYAYFEPTVNPQSSIEDGLFHYNYLDQVKRDDLSVLTDLKLIPQLFISANLNFVSFKVDDDSLKNSVDKIPYIENFNSDLGLTWKISNNTRIKLTAAYISERTTHIENSQKLAGYFLLNTSFEKQYHQFITIFVNVNNLLNEKYQLWDGYKEPGINFLCGVKGKW